MGDASTPGGERVAKEIAAGSCRRTTERDWESLLQAGAGAQRGETTPAGRTATTYSKSEADFDKVSSHVKSVYLRRCTRPVFRGGGGVLRQHPSPQDGRAPV